MISLKLVEHAAKKITEDQIEGQRARIAKETGFKFGSVHKGPHGDGEPRAYFSSGMAGSVSNKKLEWTLFSGTVAQVGGDERWRQIGVAWTVDEFINLTKEVASYDTGHTQRTVWGSDQYHCNKCGKTWDRDDPEEPPCDKKTNLGPSKEIS